MGCTCLPHRRVWHPCHTHAACYSNVLPQISQNSQKFIAEKKLPQICRRVWHPCHTHAPCYSNVLPQISRIYTDVSKMFCEFREFCGSKYLCKSVKSVGEYSLPVCSVNSVNSVGVLFWLRGYGRDAIPSYNSVEATP